MTKRDAAAAGAGLVLLTLGVGQFLMILDSSVMNVSIATVAEDVGTTVSGIQTAITLYMLVMATTMITGGKIGTIMGRRRAFSLGCIIYGCGSLTTALSPSLPVLLFGWSLLEGLGAALILPAIVALVAANFPPEARTRAYGLVAAAGAVAVAIGPVLGGIVTTYFSWRWVFAGEVVLVLLILVLARRVRDTPPPETRPRLDLVGTGLSMAGLGMVVFGILKASSWGLVRAKAGGPNILGLSPTVWLLLGGALVLYAFFSWEDRLVERDGEPLFDPKILRNSHLLGGLLTFLGQFFLQAAIFFIVPLFLSVALGLSAIDTGLRILPLSLSLLIAAVGIPRVLPRADPRRVSRVGILFILAGILLLIAGIDIDASAGVVLVPMLLVGFGIGALASQLGAVTVSAVPDEQAAEVGGLQNTFTNLGASLGTAIAGTVLLVVLTGAFLTGVTNNPDIPQEVKDQATVQLASGIPFMSDADVEKAMQAAGQSPEATQAAVDTNRDARIQALDATLMVLAVFAVIALFPTRRIPRQQPGAARPPDGAAQPVDGAAPTG
jgi:EmrB/QacA subfamily drug resistance transporter